MAATRLLSRDWLTVDASEAQKSGKGPQREIGSPGTAQSAADRAQAGSYAPGSREDAYAVEGEHFDTDPGGGGYLTTLDGEGWYPGLVQAEPFTRGPVEMPPATGYPDTGSTHLVDSPASPHGGYDARTNQYTQLNEYAGHEAHNGYATDTEGLNRYDPSGRTAQRKIHGAKGPWGLWGFWAPAENRPAARRIYQQVPGSSPPGTPGVPDSSQLPDWGVHGQITGNTATAIPHPPAVQPEPATDQPAGWDWGW